MSRVRPLLLVLGVAALLAGGCSSGPYEPKPWQGLPAATPPGVTTPPAPTPAPQPSLVPTTPPGPTTPPPTTKPTPTKTPPKKPSKPRYSTAGTQRTTGGSGVALTFDDGPDPVLTPQLLDLLRKYRVKATFCLVGKRATEFPHLVRRIVAEGHTLCNHSWNHEFPLASWPVEQIRANLQNTNAAIRKAVPNAKIAYFRAPGGNFNSRVIAIAKSMGMHSIYWTVDTRDWDAETFGHGAPMVRHIIYSVQHSTYPGGIVLSHDLGKPDTIAAYRTLLPWLKARYKLIPLAT